MQVTIRTVSSFLFSFGLLAGLLWHHLGLAGPVSAPPGSCAVRHCLLLPKKEYKKGRMSAATLLVSGVDTKNRIIAGKPIRSQQI